MMVLMSFVDSIPLFIDARLQRIDL